MKLEKINDRKITKEEKKIQDDKLQSEFNELGTEFYKNINTMIDYMYTNSPMKISKELAQYNKLSEEHFLEILKKRNFEELWHELDIEHRAVLILAAIKQDKLKW